MIVKIWFQKSNQPVTFKDADATYQKGDLFCVGYWDEADGKQHAKKYPIVSLFMVDESDFPSSQPTSGELHKEEK